MQADGLDPRKGRSARRQARPGQTLLKQIGLTLRKWENALRRLIGLRRVHTHKMPQYAATGVLQPEPVKDEEAISRIVPHAVAFVLFLLLAGGLLWGFAAFAPDPEPLRVLDAQDVVARAVDRLRDGDFEAARKLYDEASPQARALPPMNMLAGYLLAAEKPDKAAAEKRLLGRTWRRTQRLANLLTLAGFREWSRDFEGSLEALEKASKAAPTNVGVWMLKANMLLNLGRYEEAIAAADSLEEAQNSPNILAVQTRGRANLLLGRPKEAQREFRAAMLLAPDALPPRLGLVDSLEADGDYAEALAHVKSGARISPGNSDVKAREGFLHDQMGDLKAAEKAYRDAIEMDPRNANALNNLAYLLAVKLDRAKEAVPLAERAHDVATGSPAIMDTLGYAYHLAGRHKEGAELLEKAHKLLPQQKDIAAHLREAQQAAGG